MFHGSGLFALLLMVLEWTRPGLSSPLRPICDLRVLDHFIKEAWDAEAAMRTCKDDCSIATNVTVPLTRVDFEVWEAMNIEEQAQEVQSGLHMLNEAIGSLQISNQTEVLQSHIDASIRNIASIRQVLRSLSIPEYVPPTSSGEDKETQKISSISELFQVHVNFLRGKARLLLANAPVCRQGVS
ncbi:erythropoietin isoform L2 precursor [Danio rerio]|uniref:Erythropoietin n=2 Tax=Danio rerio TaxID=7955 RepID=EPO_DANRE|nr:erythropoietin isoform L2 precursor [Danio rerio]Q2XNF5.1 RecName: Full=Erythropoietin; AltName: Full=Erythropoietin-L2; Flags: Precursor [Danio rerio]AAI62974.1 Erythropoietin [Danio rerio]AAI62996.1 Erythropoietin [Danio rerio]ABB77436.1 erythropoietin [Danio rerio]ABQ41211.1 erythropoietin-L2 [Danio rerio]|eukprot:NP_001033098.1 erythropoietin isoform L2 precursor [Danio rerio]